MYNQGNLKQREVRCSEIAQQMGQSLTDIAQGNSKAAAETMIRMGSNLEPIKLFLTVPFDAVSAGSQNGTNLLSEHTETLRGLVSFDKNGKWPSSAVVIIDQVDISFGTGNAIKKNGATVFGVSSTELIELDLDHTMKGIRATNMKALERGYLTVKSGSGVKKEIRFKDVMPFDDHAEQELYRDLPTPLAIPGDTSIEFNLHLPKALPTLGVVNVDGVDHEQSYFISIELSGFGVRT